jgi:serine phosphatase RsbU (regulator of sigma subunit)
MHGSAAARILEAIDERVLTHTGDVPAGDDVTMLAVTRVA